VLGAEQAQQDRLPVAWLGVQERGELALRQHDALAEVVVGQAEQALDRLRDPAVLGQYLGRLARFGQAVRTGDPLQRRGPLADLAADPAQLPGDHVALVGRLEHQPDGAPAGGRRERERDHAPPAPAGDRPVQREGHRVDDRRLAGTGRADQGEEAGVGEVDPGRRPEGGEPVHVQHDRTHGGSPLSWPYRRW
jgi:hypothetical protein